MRVQLWQGDCLHRILDIPEASVGAMVCDPPYNLSPTGNTNPGRKSWAYFRKPENDDPVPEGRLRRARKPAAARGFMDMEWDGSDIAFSPEFWTLVHSRLVPGGVVKAFGGSRTFHRMVEPMAQAGFTNIHLEAWIYGSGFPKSLDIGKAIDKRYGQIHTSLIDLKKELRTLFDASGAKRGNRSMTSVGFGRATTSRTRSRGSGLIRGSGFSPPETNGR